jgi:hypothetical protein
MGILRLPPLGFQVVNVNVLARADFGDHTSDILAVLDDAIAEREITEGDFMTERDVLPGGEPETAAVIEHRAHNLLPCADVDDGHADVVALIVNENVPHDFSS